jgi:hypothetical protein
MVRGSRERLNAAWQQFPAVTQPKSRLGPVAPETAVAPARANNPITPVLMNQFSRKLSGLTGTQDLQAKSSGARVRLPPFTAGERRRWARVTERMWRVSGVLTLDNARNSRICQAGRGTSAAERREGAAAEAANRAATNQSSTAAKTRPKAEAPQGIAK